MRAQLLPWTGETVTVDFLVGDASELFSRTATLIRADESGLLLEDPDVSWTVWGPHEQGRYQDRTAFGTVRSFVPWSAVARVYRREEEQSERQGERR